MSEHNRGIFASASLARHLARGAVGFGLIGFAFALTHRLGPAALLLAPAGIGVLRGCPTCWLVGLIQTLSAGRLERSCSNSHCTLQRPHHGEAPDASHELSRPPA